MIKNKGGRPPTPEEVVIQQQELYLGLLRLGKTELEINAAEGAPCWDTRWRWLSDKEFSARRLEAQRQGIEFKLIDAETKLEEAFQKALDDAASPQLVAITDKIAQHARWKASKLNRETYGDKTVVEGGDKDKPVHTRVTFGWEPPSKQ